MSKDWFRAEIGGHAFEIDARSDVVKVDGVEVDASATSIGPDTYSILIDGRSYEVTVSRNGYAVEVAGIAGAHEVELLDDIGLLLKMSQEGSGGTKATAITAPMPGLVLKVEVAEGDAVTSGDGLLVLEAMKMENEIFASGDGTVRKVHVREGEAVTKNQVLLTLD